MACNKLVMAYKFPEKRDVHQDKIWCSVPVCFFPIRPRKMILGSNESGGFHDPQNVGFFGLGPILRPLLAFNFCKSPSQKCAVFIPKGDLLVL